MDKKGTIPELILVLGILGVFSLIILSFSVLAGNIQESFQYPEKVNEIVSINTKYTFYEKHIPSKIGEVFSNLVFSAPLASSSSCSNFLNLKTHFNIVSIGGTDFYEVSIFNCEEVPPIFLFRKAKIIERLSVIYYLKK